MSAAMSYGAGAVQVFLLLAGARASGERGAAPPYRGAASVSVRIVGVIDMRRAASVSRLSLSPRLGVVAWRPLVIVGLLIVLL